MRCQFNKQLNNQLNKFAVVASAGLWACSTAFAIEVMPSFAGAPGGGWNTDRFDAAVFTDIGTYQSRNNVLEIGITAAENVANRGNASGQGYLKGSFYNTQGKLRAITGGAGDTLSADLYIPAAWSNASNGNVRTDMWGIMVDSAAPTPAPPATRTNDYPIIGFTNYDGAARLRAYDSNDGIWTNFSAPINYDAWNALSIKFTGTSFEYSVNGSLVYTDTDLSTAAPSKFGYTIMQAYNFGDPSLPSVTSTADYSVHWSNVSAVPEPEAYVLALSGLMMVGVFGGARRRKV